MSATATAEERVHDVAEVEATLESTAEAALPRIAAGVVHLALLGIAEDFIGGSDVLESILRFGIRVHVGMQLACELAIGLLDLLWTRSALNAKQCVEIGAHCRLTAPQGFG